MKIDQLGAQPKELEKENQKTGLKKNIGMELIVIKKKLMN